MRYFLLIVNLLGALPALAQLDNRPFEVHYRLADSAKYGVQAHAFSFFRNLEYFTPAADGKTLFGQQIAARVIANSGPNLTVSGGTFIWKDFGNDRIQEIRPVFTLRFHKKNFAFLFGTLEGQLSHKQIEPLQDFESVINRRYEEGFQFTYNGPKLWGDLWLDWQNMIYRYSTQQERLQVGLHLRPILAEGGRGKVTGILQARAFHQGGQLDTTVGKQPLTSFFALSPGLRVETSPDAPQSFMVDGYFVTTKGITSTYPEGIRSGQGWYANAQWRNPFITTMVTYWHGQGVYVPGGGQMYSSLAQEVGASAKGLVLNTRSILILRLMRDFNLGPTCILTLRAEPQYDFLRSQVDYNYQLYINYHAAWTKWRK